MKSGVLIVDDNDVFRRQARALVEAAGYYVVAEAADCRSALAAAGEFQPDAVLLDVQLPDGDGFSVAEDLSRTHDPPRIVFISSRDAADYGTRLAQRHDDGFIHKPDLSFETLAEQLGTPAGPRSQG